ncbi:MAG: hypothetical protein MMC33_008337 [Icmadophila ericetorum]|nr:hypothetical protein [Icmadophila ericetorum]
MATNITAVAGALLSQLPQCIQAVALEGIESSGCGLDIPCVCRDGSFLATLQGAIELECNASDGQKILTFAKDLCVAAIPSLNDSRQTFLYAIESVLVALTITSVALRLVARKLSNAKYGWDDILILASLVFTLGSAVNLYLSILYGGYGKHIITLGTEQIVSFLKAYFATQLLFGTSVTLTKLSILYFYTRIFPARQFRVITIICSALVISWYIVLVFLVCFGCRPIQFYWDKSIRGGYCVNENDLSYGTTAANVVMDLIVLLLPIPSLWALHMPAGRRISLVFLFLLGGFVCIASIVRIPLLTDLNPLDVTWTVLAAGTWLQVETNLGIVCACLPTMRPLITIGIPALRSRLSKSFFGSSKGSSNDSGIYELHPYNPVRREVKEGAINNDMRGRLKDKHSKARDIPTVKTEWTVESEAASTRETGRPSQQTGGTSYVGPW